MLGTLILRDGRDRIGHTCSESSLLLLIPIVVEVVSETPEHVALLSECQLRVFVVDPAVFEDKPEIIPELLWLIVRPKFKCNINLMP